MMFPSPYGDFVFQLLSSKDHNVSHFIEGFRPLTGILFFNAIAIATKTPMMTMTFPSPYGDFVFQRGAADEKD